MALNLGQAWLTYVTSDDHVTNALVLAESIRKTGTTRRICVITSDNVSADKRFVLRKAFDHVFYMDAYFFGNRTRNELTDMDVALQAKLFAFSIRIFEKCVFVGPNTVVLENVDKLFEQRHSYFKDLTDGNSDNLFLFTPSLDLAEYLEANIWWRKGEALSSKVETWIKNNVGTKLENEKENLEVQVAPNVAVMDFSVNKGRLLGRNGNFWGNPGVVQFVDGSGETGIRLAEKFREYLKHSGKLGLIEKAIVETWMKIHEVISGMLLSNVPLNLAAEYEKQLYASEPIAIIGMSARFPGANNLEEFWNLMYAGEEAICFPPEFRWKKEHVIYPSTEKERQTQAGFLSQPVDMFDSKFFGVSPKDSVLLDPQARLLHEVLWEGLENSGIDPHSLHGSHTGIFTGSWMNDYKDIIQESTERDFFRTYMGNSIGATAARLSFLLGLTGPSIATESGCSSAIVAVDLAVKSLRNGESNLALAGGVNLLLHPFKSDIIDYVIAPDGRCKTFDEKADGFGRAEGCGVLVLKRLSDALRDKDNIWAMIRGSAVSQEGLSRSLGTPTVHCEALAMELALKDANITPDKVSFVETHGTGTSVGDPMEVAAIAKAYHSKARKDPLIIGSVKTNVGHTESCSGITGIIKTVLAMQHELIPRHRNLDTLNPQVKLEAIPAQIPTEHVSWPKIPGKPRLAGVSSFGITGTDGHVIIEEAPDTKLPNFSTGLERPLHVVKFSGKSSEAFDEVLQLYTDYFKMESRSADKTLFENVAYTANTGRASFGYRAFLLASNYDDAVKVIDTNKIVRGESGEPGRKLCFLFTGQGSQYPGMARGIYETSPVFRFHFDKCDAVLRENYNLSIRQVIWESDLKSKELGRTIYSQTSIFVVEYCLLKLWESWGIKPDYVLGHSLGEFCAAVAAGVLTFEDALMLVAERSRLIDNLPRGSMLVIKANFYTVDKLMKQKRIDLDYAAVNSQDQTVVAGDTEKITEFLKICKSEGLKAIILDASHAFHSRHMDPMLEAYRKVVETVQFSKPSSSCQYISGMEGKLLRDTGFQINAKYWVRHTREKVSFLGACKALKELGCQHFLEVGPQPVLSSFVMQNIDNAPVSCYPSLRRSTNEWETILTSLGKLYLEGFKVDWEGYDRPYIRQKVSTLPYHPFNRKSLWVECRLQKGIDIHPLVGTVLANASSQNIFQNDISLKSAYYLKDHCIGNMAVFPGAAFTEMCLSAGYCVANVLNEKLEKPRNAIAVENLKIEAPLELQEGKSQRLQTIVKLRDESGNSDVTCDSYCFECKIYHQTQNEDEDGVSNRSWVGHASATFYPYVSQSSLMQLWNNGSRVAEMVSTLEASPLDSFYKMIDSVGLKFGEQFRMLRQHWVKQAENSGMDEVVAELEIPEDCENYLLHPLVIDSMIQAGLLCGWRTQSESLRVPVGIGKLTLTNNLDEQRDAGESTLYLHAKWNEDTGKCQIFVATSKTLTLIAVLEDVEVIETNVKTIQSVLAQQHTPIPDSWEEYWKPVPGPFSSQVELATIKPVFTREDFKNRIRGVVDRNTTPEDGKQLAKMNRMITLFVFRALIQLGWKPKQGEIIIVEEFCKRYHILEQFAQLVNFYFKIVQEQVGLMEMEWQGHHKWLVGRVSNFSVEELEAEAKSIFEELKTVKRVSAVVKIYQYLGNMLGEILRGEKSILPILFPEEGQREQFQYSAETFYQTYPGRVEGVETIKETVDTIWRHLHSLNNSESATGDKKRVLRVMEVGAGTASMTMAFIPVLAEVWGAQFEFYFTDVSAAFFGKAEKKFGEYPGTFKFCTFDIEKSPLDQGIPLNYFDIVLASDVLHIANNLKECLINLRQTLKPQGHLFFTDTFAQDHGITLIFGLLEGYWNFQDFDIRPDHCCVSGSTWSKLLLENGFDFVDVAPVYQGVMGCVFAEASEETGYDVVISKANKGLMVGSEAHKWILFLPEGAKHFEKVASVMRASGFSVIVVTPPPEMEKKTEEEIVAMVNSVLSAAGSDLQGIVYAWATDKKVTDQKRIALPFLHIAQHVLEMKKAPKTYVFTRDVHAILETNVELYPSGATLFGMTKSLKNEYAEMFARVVDLEDGAGGRNEEVDKILFELTMNKQTRDRERLQVGYKEGVRFEPRMNKSGLPHNPARDDLQLPPSSEKYQLMLPESKTFKDLTFDVLEEQPMNENDVEVATKAYALNFRDIFSVLKPTKEFENEKGVGLDFAGVVTKVGAKVTPDKLKVGDRVFGIKMKQIPLPSHLVISADYLVKIPEKMTFSEAATLPAVFSTSYYCLLTIAKMKKGDTVLIHTGSGGVGLSAIQLAKHVGANIITTAGSPRKRAYLKSLGIEHVFHSRNTSYEQDIMRVTNGRGVDVVLNSLTGPGFKEATLASCAKKARFVEMSKLSVWSAEEVKQRRSDVEYSFVDLTQLETSEWTPILQAMKGYITDGHVTPIPYVQYDALRIRQALQYFQKAKHIGKVVVRMPEVNTRNGQWNVNIPLFNPEGVYVITGGLGGIGFEVCKWMLTKGATDIVLIGRNPPKQEIDREIERLNKSNQGYNVMVKLADVGNYSQLKDILNEIMATCHKPIRGIQHCAGVIQDNLYSHQTWEAFMATYNPKIIGTWNLHNLTRECPLEHFVLYSSITALMGTPSQANHSSANCFEDSFAHYRYSLGLPATAINWGQWAQVGVAKEINVMGALPVSVARMLNGLEETFRSGRLQVAIGEFESLTTWCLVCPSFKHYLDERLKLKDGSDKGNQVLIKSDQFWQSIDDCSGNAEKMEVVMVYMKAILRAALRMDADENINEDANLKDLGVDSLMLIELKNSIQSLFGSRLHVSANMLKDCQTIRELGEAIVRRLEDNNEVDLKEEPTPEELFELLKKDCVLDTNIQPPSRVAESVKTVLVTGSTGQFGPYVLAWLTQNATWLDKIVCLIRTSGGQSPDKKLKNVLESMKMLAKVDLTKVECIQGDMTQPNFGLDSTTYAKLADSIDCVIHLAAKSNHVEYYRKSAKDLLGNDLRAVNVGGCLNVLKFASTSKTKRVYHASSILCIFGGGDDPTALSDNWPEHDEINKLIEYHVTGYPISKYVCEMLMRQANERGIPCKVFRFPYIMGDSRTGQLNYIQNHYILRFMSYLKIKTLPAAPLPAIVLPVDICADLSMKVFWNKEAPNEVYNIAHPNPQLEVEFQDVAKEEFGINMEVVTWETQEFMDTLYAKGMPMESLKEMYSDLNRALSVTHSGAFQAIQGYLDSPESFFINKKIRKVIPNFERDLPSTMEIIRTNLNYVRSMGFFEKFGL